eukprot:40743_1
MNELLCKLITETGINTDSNLYIVVCFSLLAIVFISLIPETNDNIPLWIRQSELKLNNFGSDEMGDIYLIYETDTPFKRWINRLNGTNCRTEKRILLSNINSMAQLAEILLISFYNSLNNININMNNNNKTLMDINNCQFKELLILGQLQSGI